MPLIGKNDSLIKKREKEDPGKKKKKKAAATLRENLMKLIRGDFFNIPKPKEE